MYSNQFTGLTKQTSVLKSSFKRNLKYLRVSLAYYEYSVVIRHLVTIREIVNQTIEQAWLVNFCIVHQRIAFGCSLYIIFTKNKGYRKKNSR